MTRTPPQPPTPKPEQWQRKRKPKWRDIYVKARVQNTWKRWRKRQTWR